MIKLPWKRWARPLEHRQPVNPRIIELETAKQILEEIFHVRPSDVDEMIQMRLEEKSWSKESWQEEEEPCQESSAWVSSMGGSFESVRMGAKEGSVSG